MKPLFLMLGASCCIMNTFSQQRPNIICILADDLGYTDIGCYGAEKIKTPSIDTLAAQGVRFTNAYAPASTSSPSRYALLTGEYAWRKNVGILPADAPLSIDTAKNTLPKMLQKLGYSTGLVGKWHLGLGSKNNPVNFNEEISMGPHEIGFDYCYYFPATNDRVPCLFIENERVDGLDTKDPIEVSYRKKIGEYPTGAEHPELLSMPYHLGHDGTIINGISRIGWMKGGKKALWKDDKMADHLFDKVKEFIHSQKDAPFFLYYAPHNAHEPRVPSKAFKGKSQAGVYGDVIEEFDDLIGRLVEILKKEGLYENTILIISSDNAPMIKEGYQDGALENINGHNPYGNLRGEKYSLHEGGTKVPFIFSWPAVMKSPFIQEQPFVYLDLLSTLSSLIGSTLSDSEKNDSRDGSKLFLSKEAPIYRPYIMTQNNAGQVALRMGKWKYIPHYNGQGAELYDLNNDPSELHNIIYAYPEIVRRFSKIMKTDYKKEYSSF